MPTVPGIMKLIQSVPKPTFLSTYFNKMSSKMLSNVNKLPILKIEGKMTGTKKLRLKMNFQISGSVVDAKLSKCSFLLKL